MFVFYPKCYWRCIYIMPSILRKKHFFLKNESYIFSVCFEKSNSWLILLFTVMFVCVHSGEAPPSRQSWEWGWYSSFLPMLSSLHNRDPEINKNVLKGTFWVNYLKYMNYFPFFMFSIDINVFFWEQKARHLWEDS